MIPLKDEYLLCQKCYCNGAWTAADDGQAQPVLNPADGKVLGSIPWLGGAEVRRTLDAAAAASEAWAGRAPRERATLLRRWSEAIAANQEDLAVLLTAEQGKPLREARAEVAWSAGRVEWFAEEARRVQTIGQSLLVPGSGVVASREPAGLMAAIVPWNEPLAMAVRKAAPALAAGCPVVLKPATATPFSALALAELADRAGLPAGVFNVITGSARTLGQELASHPEVQLLAFAGPAEVGSRLMEACAPAGKRLFLERGGRSNFIVFDDADLEAAVRGAVAARFANTGQAPIGCNWFLVQEGALRPFAEALARAVDALKVGDGLRGDTRQGPLIDERAPGRLQRLVDDAVAQGAEVVTGGRRHALGGSFFQPTVLARGTPAMAMAREAAIGPVALLVPFRDEAELFGLAQGVRPVLASCFYTADPGRIWRVAGRLRAGVVAVNQGVLRPAGVTGDGADPRPWSQGAGDSLGDYLTERCVILGEAP